MPDGNLDLVRAIYAEWERGDYSSAGWAHPQIELVIADLPDQGISKGPRAARLAWEDFLQAWEGHRVEVEEYRELDEERVLVVGSFTARGRTSGLDVQEMRSDGANLLTVRAGKVTRLVIYFDRDRALADLGLHE
jgi:ketosteroid isomerase-like protein